MRLEKNWGKFALTDLEFFHSVALASCRHDDFSPDDAGYAWALSQTQQRPRQVMSKMTF